MSGYLFAMGECVICHNLFSFNPERVPSTTAFNGQREPVCEHCMARVNARRKERGLEPFPILPDAYGAEEV